MCDGIHHDWKTIAEDTTDDFEPSERLLWCRDCGCYKRVFLIDGRQVDGGYTIHPRLGVVEA